MKKILLITHDFSPLRGGVARYLDGLYKRYDASKLVLLLDKKLDTKEAKQLWYHKKKVSVHYTNFFVPWLYPRWIPLFIRVYKLVKKEHIEEVHVSHVLPLGTICMLLFRMLHIPYRIYFHGQDILIANNKRFKRIMLEHVLRNADSLVANSKFTQKQVRTASPVNKKVIVWYPRVSKSTSARKAAVESFKDQYALHGKFVFLTVARLVKRKGVDLALGAIAEAVKSVPNIVYVVVGDGQEARNLYKQAHDLKLENNIRFVGAVSDEDLLTWYSLAGAFIMTTHAHGTDVEGFGMVYQEAGSHSLPSIATNCGGVKESVEHTKTGIVLPKENKAAITETIVYFAKNPKYVEKLGKAAKQRFKDFFSWENWNRDKEIIFDL